MKSQSTRSQAKKKQAASPSGFSRVQVVWGALCLAMTAVGGALWMLDGSKSLGIDGMRLPSLVAPDITNSIDSIFNTRAPMDNAPWQAIVIHHSGAPFGSAETIEKDAKAMGLSGLGYHFVVGNGSGAGDGELHVGYRWLDQLPGAHTAGQYGEWYNRNSIGICLVGDGDRGEFTGAQITRLVQTVRALQRELGIPAQNVILHRDVAQTTSPGQYFPIAAFQEQLLSNPN
ncbi:MAG: peptidoglycan recognition family protein [Phycisphaerales bacterium JB061]